MKKENFIITGVIVSIIAVVGVVYFKNKKSKEELSKILSSPVNAISTVQQQQTAIMERENEKVANVAKGKLYYEELNKSKINNTPPPAPLDPEIKEDFVENLREEMVNFNINYAMSWGGM
jgi:hypothetical protein